MNVKEFAGADFSLIQFSYQIADEVGRMLQQKKFVYQNQIWNYVKDRVETFLSRLEVKKSLECIYKSQLYSMIDRKIGSLISAHNILVCI